LTSIIDASFCEEKTHADFSHEANAQEAGAKIMILNPLQKVVR
jgi:hypothetical protein